MVPVRGLPAFMVRGQSSAGLGSGDPCTDVRCPSLMLYEIFWNLWNQLSEGSGSRGRWGRCRGGRAVASLLSCSVCPGN